MKATLDSDGRIQLPSTVQSQLGVKPGDDVILDSQEGQGVIRSERATVGLCQEGNVLIHCGTSSDSVEVILAECREERLNQLGEGLSG
ncbi:MAG: AbrB/MazE/SpoVT family DNA-binding domain-containing protein [Planctomycetota bacterium]